MKNKVLLVKDVFFLVDDSNEPKKVEDVNKNVVAKVCHNEYKVFLLNKKCLRYSNRIQSKNYKIETSEIKKCLCRAFKIKYIS